ncbi:MAG: hypothetical protein WCK78_16315 [Paludibacter sp.]
MNLDTYGLIPENPIQLDSDKAAIAFLQNLVTKHDGYHILYHKLMSFDFNVFDGREKTVENTVEIYEICTNDQKIISLFINTHCNECVWIPPAPFEFESESIYIFDKDIPDESDEYIMVQVDVKFVNTIRMNWTPDDYDTIDPDSMEYVLYRSWGVNYKTNNFPYELWNQFQKEHTFSISDLNEEELEQHNKMLVGLLINDENLKERLN